MSKTTPTMTCLLHGESGVGKSWTAASAPRPRLICDLEGRAKHTPGRKVFWDPMQGAPPEDDGTWDTCVAVIQSYTVLDHVYQWLRSGQHPFKSVIVDSLMEAQKRFIDELKGMNQLTTPDWGTILRALEKFVRDMRDITNIEAAHVDVVVIVTGSVPDERNKARPLLQGALRNTLPYYLDVVGWLHLEPDLDDPQKINRILTVGPTAYAVTKYGLGTLDQPHIIDPDLNALYELKKKEFNS